MVGREYDTNVRFIRQRRNLIAFSLIIIFYKSANLELTRISFLGNEVRIGNSEIVLLALSGFFFYFLWRFYTVCLEERGLRRFLDVCRSWAEESCRKRLKTQYKNARSIHLIQRNPRFLIFNIDEPSNRRDIVIRKYFLLMKFLSLFRCALLSSTFSEYVFPYILAIIAISELAELGLTRNIVLSMKIG